MTLFLNVVWEQRVKNFNVHQIQNFTILVTYFILIVCYIINVTIKSIVFFKRRIKNFKYGENMIDFVIILGFLPIILHSTFIEFIDEEYKLPNILVTSYLLVVAYRAIKDLRCFNSLRTTILIIIRVVKGLGPFLIILAILVGILAGLEVQLSKSLNDSHSNAYDGTLGEFLKMMDRIFKITYGSWDDSNSYEWNRYIVFLLSNVILPMVMFNLLMARVFHIYEIYYKNR